MGVVEKYGLYQMKIPSLAYAASDGSSQPAHPHSPIKTLPFLLHTDLILYNVLPEGNE